MNYVIGAASLIATLLIYIVCRKINQRYPSPFTIPVLVGTVIIVIGLLVLDIPYETYNIGAKWINELLGPAVVALAYPLYKQWDMLTKNIIPILTSVVVAAIVGVGSGVLLAKWFGFGHDIIYSISPKSVTTPVAMDIAHSIGGVPSLAAVFVMLAGIGGAVMSSYVYKFTKIDGFLGKGLGMGCASHAIGIAMAMENSEEEGAAATIGMGMSSIVVSIITQPLIWLLV